MSQTTKISLIISGAISLGSYQAGVIEEIFQLLQKVPGTRRFEIDVVTGASAGSVNSVICALALLYDPKLIEFARKIWLDGLDLSVLLEPVDQPQNSVFSNRIIRQLKTELLQAVRDSAGPPPDNGPESIKLTLTLTNLSGIPYEIKFRNQPQPSTLTTFADWFTVELRRGDKSPETLQQLDRLLEVAIASGSFPFAFTAQSVTRSWEDYRKTALPQPPSGDLDFIYVDGGVFNNEPINRARELADSQDEPGTERIYLLIDPSPPVAEPSFMKKDMLAVAARLIPAIFTEAHFRDWYHAVKINQRLEWQQDLIRVMKDYLAQLGTAEFAAVTAAWSQIRGPIVAFKAQKAGVSATDYWQQNLARLKQLLISDGTVAMVEQDSAVHSALADFVFVMESVGNLRGKKLLDIRLLTPREKGLLAGDFLINFGGFFAPEYRLNDFNIGREVARDFFRKPEAEGGLGVDLSALALEPVSYDPDLGRVDIKDAPDQHKIKLRENVVQRSDAILEELMTKYRVKLWQRLAIPLVMMFAPWKWLIKKVVRSSLIRILNAKLGIK